jgi:hypothetical protein
MLALVGDHLHQGLAMVADSVNPARPRHGPTTVSTTASHAYVMPSPQGGDGRAVMVAVTPRSLIGAQYGEFRCEDRRLVCKTMLW